MLLKYCSNFQFNICCQREAGSLQCPLEWAGKTHEYPRVWGLPVPLGCRCRSRGMEPGASPGLRQSLLLQRGQAGEDPWCEGQGACKRGDKISPGNSARHQAGLVLFRRWSLLLQPEPSAGDAGGGGRDLPVHPPMMDSSVWRLRASRGNSVSVGMVQHS